MFFKSRQVCKLGYYYKYCLLGNNLYSTQKAVAPVSTEGITISDNCVQKLKKLCSSDDNFLRVCVESGGCSGFQYKFDLDNKVADDDKCTNISITTLNIAINSQENLRDICQPTSCCRFYAHINLHRQFPTSLEHLCLKLGTQRVLNGKPINVPPLSVTGLYFLKGNRIFEKDGVKVVIDDTSLDFIKGSTVDYHTELIRSAFRIVQNPNAELGCSCGASFSIKID